jgi:allophanate hydrolase subunit 2
VGPARADAAGAGRSAPAPAYARGVARVLLGPHHDRVDVATFLAAEFVVDERSDRMGVRLRGRAVPTAADDLVTTGVVEGAVQIPPGGDPIVLLADHQTTGGYPVVATVIAADLPIVAQRDPGETLRFAATTAAEAVAELQRVRRDVFAVRAASD